MSKNVAKITVVSTLPFTLKENKPGMFPSYYEIEGVKKPGDIAVTHISDAYYLEMIPLGDSRAPQRRIDIVAERVAEGIIFDYVSASLGVSHDPLDNGAVRTPGMFWLNGILDASIIKAMHSGLVESALRNTKAWFEGLVKLADDDWQKFRQHKMITDLQRYAGRYLELKDRDWCLDLVELRNNKCWACMSVVNAEAIMCMHCKAVLNQELYEANKARFVTA